MRVQRKWGPRRRRSRLGPIRSAIGAEDGKLGDGARGGKGGVWSAGFVRASAEEEGGEEATGEVGYHEGRG